MTSLKDFEIAPEYSLEDLKGNPVKSSSGNEATISHIASYGAALSSDVDPVEAYRSIYNDLEVSGESFLLNRVRQEFQDREYVRGRETFLEIMSDPTVPEEIKKAAIQTFEQEFTKVDLRQMVSEEAVISGKESGEITPEYEEIETRLIRGIRIINDQARVAETLINKSKLAEDSSSVAKVVDFLELLIPFAEGKQVGNVLTGIRKEFDKNTKGSSVKGLFLMGEAKQEIIDTFKRVPPEQRHHLYSKIIDIVESNNSLILPDGNDLSSLNLLKQAIGLETYSTAERLFDDAISILDTIGVLSFIGGVGRFFTRGPKSVKTGSNIAKKTKNPNARSSTVIDNEGNEFHFEDGYERRGERDVYPYDEYSNDKDIVLPRVSSTSLGENYTNTNVDKARAAHEAAMSDEEAAQVIYGASRDDVAVHNIGPEVASSDGSVKNKIPNPNKIHDINNSPDATVMDFINHRSDTYLWKQDKEAMRSNVVRNFKDALGLTDRANMMTIKANDDGVTIRAMYGLSDHGFSDPVEAIEHVKFVLRDFGITDDNITLNARRGNRYYPIKLEDVDLNKDIDYLVGVDYNYKFRPEDLNDDFVNLTVKRNFFSQYDVFSGSGGRGSLTTHLFDKDSIFDPKITSSMMEHVDKSGRLENMLTILGSKFAIPFSKLSKERKAKISNLIKEANAYGIEHSQVQLKAAGFKDNEIEIINAWRKVWDTIYWLENRDYAITLRQRGYRVLVDTKNKNKFFVREQKQRSVKDGVQVYDPDTDQIINLNRAEIDDLYDKGGNVSEVLGGINLPSGDVIDFVKVDNTRNNYTRVINDNDEVLNYRKGYYQVIYKDPIFIDEVKLNADGSIKSKRAVATARNIKDANHMVNRLEKTNTKANIQYIPRKDRVGTPTFREARFEMAISSGRIAQRFRGKRLESNNHSIYNPEQENILDPVDALSIAAKSISERAIMRNPIESLRTRFMKQYSDLLPENGNWPKNSLDIQPRGGDVRVSRKRVADARDVYEYITFLEDGYINTLDDSFKAIFNMTADILGKSKYTPELVEEGLRKLGTVDISSEGKGLAFKLLLAPAPLRQFFVQGHQAVQLLYIFPRYTLTKLVPDSFNLFNAMLFGRDTVTDAALKLSGMSRKEFNKLVDDFIETGLWENVDKHSFVRNNLKRMADRNAWEKAKSVINKPLEFGQVIGFDTGERIAQMTSWLAHRDAAKRAGRNLDSAEVRGEIHGAARAFTYSMNRAGEMPYNENHLSLIMMYMQVAHKSILQQLTNRHLTKSQRVRMLVGNTLMYGVPSVLTPTLISLLPNSESWALFVNYGLGSYVYNQLLSLAFREEVGIDFTSVDPRSPDGMYQLVGSIVNDSLLSALANTPVISMFAGDNPRIANLFSAIGRFATTQDYEDPTTFKEVAFEAASLFSGFSHTFKSIYALKTGQMINSYGDVMDDDVNFPEAIALALGLGTQDVRRDMDVLERFYSGSYSGSNDMKNDAKKLYDGFKKHLFINGITKDEIEHTFRLYAEAWRVFDTMSDDRAREEFFRLMDSDRKKGDYRFMEMVIGSAGRGKTINELREMALLISDDDARKMAVDLVNFLEKHNTDPKFYLGKEE